LKKKRINCEFCEVDVRVLDEYLENMIALKKKFRKYD
jgi:hypothetical protein